MSSYCATHAASWLIFTATSTLLLPVPLQVSFGFLHSPSTLISLMGCIGTLWSETVPSKLHVGRLAAKFSGSEVIRPPRHRGQVLPDGIPAKPIMNVIRNTLSMKLLTLVFSRVR
jgi:hypothetical protein